MTVAIIGAGGIGSAIARQLASGGENLRAVQRRQSVGTNAGGQDRWSRGRRREQR